MAAEDEGAPEPTIVRSHLNSYHYLYQDAEMLCTLAETHAGAFEEVRFSRTAILLYVFSLEGLINRALESFLPSGQRDYFLEREDRLSISDKWLLVPLLSSPQGAVTFDRGVYPWNCFADLISLRNDFVHPKHDRVAFYRWFPNRTFGPLDWQAVPKDAGIAEKELVYRQIRVPKDPHSLQAVHVQRVKEVVDAMVAELNRLLGGLLDEAWLHEETIQPAYPPGAKFRFKK